MKIYIVKTYTVAHYGFKRLDEEKGFNSYLEALEYLQEEFFEEEDNDESYLKSYFAEIVEYYMQDKEIIITKTRFDCLGKVFATFKSTDNQRINYQSRIDKNFSPSFNIGDIVTLKYQNDTSVSLFDDTIGVVTGVPMSYIEWKDKYNRPDDFWDPVYMVEFVEDSGYLTHCHPVEEEMEAFNKKLPEELVILEKLSKYVKEEIIIKEEIIKSLRAGDIYALNTKTIKDIDWE